MNETVDFLVWVWGVSPPIARGFLILLGGWVLALVIRALLRGALVLFRFDRFADRVGLGEFLRNGNVAYRPAKLVSVLIYRLVLLVAFLVASRALDIAAVNSITDSLVQSLPAVIAAIFITLIGLVIVSFLANVVETIVRNTSMTNVHAVVNTFRYIGYSVILLLASDQLGFGKSLLSSLLLIAFAATALGLAIAFGLGSVDIARRTVEDFLKGLSKHDPEGGEPKAPGGEAS